MTRTSRVAHSAALPIPAPALFALGCDHLAASGPGWHRCDACGASAWRDATGAIVEYDASGQRSDEDRGGSW